jgi:hypothetical protein
MLVLGKIMICKCSSYSHLWERVTVFYDFLYHQWTGYFLHVQMQIKKQFGFFFCLLNSHIDEYAIKQKEFSTFQVNF